MSHFVNYCFSALWTLGAVGLGIFPATLLTQKYNELKAKNEEKEEPLDEETKNQLKTLQYGIGTKLFIAAAAGVQAIPSHFEPRSQLPKSIYGFTRTGLLLGFAVAAFPYSKISKNKNIEENIEEKSKTKEKEEELDQNTK